MTAATNSVRTASSASADSGEAARELAAGLWGASASCVVFFASIAHDGATIGDALRAAFPGVPVVGCSSNGEFATDRAGKGGAVAMALPPSKARRAACALADLSSGVAPGISAAASELSRALGADLRELDPERFVGLALLEGAKGQEERINEALGNVAPALNFVGGSAGDDIQFLRTWVYANGERSDNGAALLVLDMAVPFEIVKMCNAVPTEHEVTVGRVDGRVVYVLDDKPARTHYAELIGADPEKLGFNEFLHNPLGLIIDGEAWLRSGVKVVDGDGLFFACELVEGMHLSVMKTTDIVRDTRAKVDAIEAKLGGAIGGAVLFNCAYRMLEADIKGVAPQVHEILARFPHAGLHSNGESWLGHMNQTMVGLVFA